jgi:hypothetical protein
MLVFFLAFQRRITDGIATTRWAGRMTVAR